MQLRRTVRTGWTAFLIAALVTASAAPAMAYDAISPTERVSVATGGGQAPQGVAGSVGDADVSTDGRFVVFSSEDTTLGGIPDGNGSSDVFRRDRQSDITTLVSVTPGGSPGNSFSYDPSISGDGRYVAFTSISSDLVVGDSNAWPDVFVRDILAGTTVRVSTTSGGSQVTLGGGGTSISRDGRYVTFMSEAADLVPGHTGNTTDVFVHDRDADADGTFDEAGQIATVLVSVASDGTQADVGTYGRISPNGRYVALGSESTTLVPVVQMCERYEPDPLDPYGFPILVPAWCSHAFLHDRDPDEDGVMDEPGEIATTLAGVTSSGAQLDGHVGGIDVADDGDIAFWTHAPALGGSGPPAYTNVVAVHDHGTGVTEVIGLQQGNNPSIDDSGRYVAFDSGLANGVAGDTNNATDILVRDRVSGTIERVSVDPTGAEVGLGGVVAYISGDARHVVFLSYAPNLVSGDTNGTYDLFARDRQAGTTGGVPTPTGTNVAVQPAGFATLTFDDVNTAGTTTLTTSTGGPTPPGGFLLGDPPTYYDLSTTALFSGLVTVCLDYSGTSFVDEATLRLLHYVLSTGQWEDVTTSLDTVSDVICGRTSSFSPFLIGESIYRFGGFNAPVDPRPTLNKLKAGSAVPVKFSLGGDLGLDIFAAGFPKSEPVPCGSSSNVDGIETTVTAGQNSLKYIAATGLYEYIWKTDKGWRECRQLVIRFKDGVAYRADFWFTK